MDQNEETTATEELEQPDEAFEQDDLPEELPDDPVELKKIAATAISQAKTLKQKNADARSERERLEDNLEEQRTTVNYLKIKLEESGGLKTTKTPPPPEKDPASERGLDDSAELADMITSGITLGELKKMWQEDAEKITEKKADTITKQGAHARGVVGEYPDLNKDDSPLAKATIAEMALIDQEMQGISDQAKFELATRRSAARLGIEPVKRQNNREDAERTRRRTAQGGPVGRPTSPKGSVVITDADRALARKMNGGQDVPDKVLIEAKKRVQPPQQQRA